MKLAKPSSKYRTISLSDPLVERIREIIADDPKFRSVADYVNIAVKEKMTHNEAQIKYDRAKKITSFFKSHAPEDSDMVVELQQQLIESQKTIIELQKLKRINPALDKLQKEHFETVELATKKQLEKKKKSESNGVRLS